jgi:hypothetical protein
MTSPPLFSPAGYDSLLDAIDAGGYTRYGFEETLAAGARALWLRHDIDKDIGCARRMAEQEQARGVRATYFFLLHCPLYSLLEPGSWEAVQEIIAMGHSVGLHCDERPRPTM